jgi:hypothetical protein
VLYGFVKMVLTSDLVKALPFLSYTMQGHVIAVTPLLHMGVVEAPVCNMLDNFPRDDVRILPLLVETIQSDDDLEVVSTAFRIFNNLTKLSFEFPNYGQVVEWWNKNRTLFDQIKSANKGVTSKNGI